MDKLVIDEKLASHFTTLSASLTTGAAFKLYTSPAPSGLALTTDIGCGKTAIALSTQFNKVICMCRTEKNAALIKKRLSMKNIDNVQLIVCQLSSAPFESKCFDNISLHALPITYIKSITRKLPNICAYLCKDHGEIYISINFGKNKLLKYLLTLIKFIIAIKNVSLVDAGRIYHYPSITKFIFLRSINGLSISSSSFEIKRLLAGDNIGFLLKMPRTQSISLSEQIKQIIEVNLSTQLEISSKVLVGSHESIICDFGNVIVRLPQSSVAIARCHTNFDNLGKLQNYKLPFMTPKPMFIGSTDGQYFFVESKLDGKSLDTLMSEEAFQSYQDQGASILLHEDMPFETQTISEAIRNYCLHDCMELKKYLTPAQREIFDSTMSVIQNAGEFISIPRTIQHGDFKYSNFLCGGDNNQAITGVIDWDMGNVLGLPLMDVLTVSIYKPETEPKDFAMSILDFTHQEPPNKQVKDYCLKFGINTSEFNLVCFFLAIRYINLGFHPHQKSRKEWQQEIFINKLIPACNDLFLRYQNL